MEGNTSWVSNYCYNTSFDNKDCETFSEVEDEENEPMVSVDSILPDELIERILACLPIASIFRAGSVCKRWHDVVSSKRFLWHFLNSVSQKPWYFMFTSTDDPVGYSYDPTLRKWYSLELPRIVTSSWFIASSFGLVCFMNNDNQTGLHIYNPITRSLKRLIEPPGVKFSDYNALAMSVDRVSHRYTISVVRSKQVPENFFQWDLSIHVYDSKTLTWVTSLSEVLNGWRAGDESVICNGFLYFLIYSAGGGIPDSRHGLIRYDLSSNPTRGLLIRNVIPVPCPLTCGRLMNLKEMLVMVGGIGKQYRTDIIKGIAIWVLKGTEWKEIARMPHRFFQGFGELDDVFASSGTEDMIYIQSYGAPALLVFDMNSKQWKWSQKCPVTKRFPLQLFTGFCFEPRLEICP